MHVCVFDLSIRTQTPDFAFHAFTIIVKKNKIEVKISKT